MPNPPARLTAIARSGEVKPPPLARFRRLVRRLSVTSTRALAAPVRHLEPKTPTTCAGAAARAASAIVLETPTSRYIGVAVTSASHAGASRSADPVVHQRAVPEVLEAVEFFTARLVD